MNPDDDIRDKILRFLYERHKMTKGITKIPIGIRDLQGALRSSYGFKQHEVSSNLDYLIQVGWVKEVVRERSFKTPKGMELSQEQIKYKISDVGINHLEAGTMFRRADSSKNVNITNIHGVMIVGDGNIVNTQFTDLSRALDDLDQAVSQSADLTDAQKLDAQTKRPVGAATPIYEFDEALVPGMDPVWNNISVDGNRIILELGGGSTGIWIK